MPLQTMNIGASANDGTGDPLRTAMDKVNDNFLAVSSNVFNVKDPAYGAVGDGVTNDTAAIHAASTAAAAVGGVVKFPFTPNSYNLASITASATPSASVPGTRAAAPADCGVGGRRRHAAWPHVADAVIEAYNFTFTLPSAGVRWEFEGDGDLTLQRHLSALTKFAHVE
jgi:hypothetical protein